MAARDSIILEGLGGKPSAVGRCVSSRTESGPARCRTGRDSRARPVPSLQRPLNAILEDARGPSCRRHPATLKTVVWL